MPEPTRAAVRRLQKEALDLLRHTLGDIAEVLDVSRASVARYDQKTLVMTKKTRRKMAAYLRRHAKKALRLADKLDQ